MVPKDLGAPSAGHPICPGALASLQIPKKNNSLFFFLKNYSKKNSSKDSTLGSNVCKFFFYLAVESFGLVLLLPDSPFSRVV